jgi:hypothetical protein
MGQIDDALRSARVLRATGECHALMGVTESQARQCIRVLRGQTCSNGLSAYLTCRPRPKAKPATRPQNVSRRTGLLEQQEDAA